ncbi:inverse autotransporter beta domain-containing protein, partial [Aeromonas sobria]
MSISKRIVWINLIFQSGFPIATTFSPMVLANVDGENILVQSPPVNHIKKYHLKDGETLADVAQKLGVSLDSLIVLNNSKGTIDLTSEYKSGDDILIPASTFHFNDELDKSSLDESTIASLASQFGNAQNSDGGGKVASQMVHDAAVQAVSKTSQQWLEQFGTARVKIGVNEDFSLEGTELDLLVPMYDDGNQLWFAQSGLRHIDERTTFNAGIGVRFFKIDNWMLGSNMFIDNDLTGHNRRIGVGAEAWTDYLKLTGNLYHGLTDWHQSRDFDDYDERPADGFDLRSEAYIPQLPQLGGKLIFEQYFGNEVALFGNGESARQKDPHAITTEINYTPFPMLTAAVGHRMGSGGENDTNIGLTLNYQLGVPIEKQLNGNNVASNRVLAGNRLDLVDRNNKIVLEYRKQDIITASLPPSVTGNAGNNLLVTLTTTSKYGLKDVMWDATALIAAGGSLEEIEVDKVKITLPAYQSQAAKGAQDINTYLLGAIAYDVKGNASERVTTNLMVSPGETLITTDNMTVEVDNAQADGTARNKVQVKVTRADGQTPVEGELVTFTADNGATLVGSSAISSDAAGLAMIELTSLRPGVSTISAVLSNGAGQSKQVTFMGTNAPQATSVTIDNTSPTVGDVLTGSYTYSDADSDVEGTSTYKWYRNGAEISGAT